MSTSHKVAMLGTGLIGMFYTMALHGQRSRDEVAVVYSRQQSRADEFARQWGIAKATTDLKAAIQDPAIDTVVIGLPNFQHIECVELAAAAGKAILCTKPLGRNAKEAKHMLDVVEKAGVFHGYLEDLAYTPKTLKALASVRAGALGDVLWARSRETHPGPHSAWFWDKEQAGRRCHHRPWLSLRRNHSQLCGQGKPARRSHVLVRYARAPHSGRRQCHRPDQV